MDSIPRYFDMVKQVHAHNPLFIPQPRTRVFLELLNLSYQHLLEDVMARKKSDQGFNVDFGDTWFAQSNLTDEALKECDKWVKANEPELGTFLNESLNSGDKISWSYDLAHDTLICSLTIRDNKSAAYGAIITSRSQDAFDALSITMWKRWIYLDLEELKNQGTLNTRG